jgi:hypothetical protein
MDNKKFETLIDLIINENEEQARELFHEIVVEKSREIYESIMDEEMMEAADDEEDAIEESMEDDIEEHQMAGQVGDLLDEINAEESGVTEEEEEEVFDLEADGEEDLGDEGDAGGEGMEDAVIRIEDKLDQLMAEFEEIMGGNAGDIDDEADEVASEEMMEAVQLQKVSVTHGDNGAQTKSPGLQNSGQAGMDCKPVKFSGQAETVPTSPKGPNNPYSKGETQVKGAGQFKNAPGHKGADLSKAPAPKKGDNGVNTKSPIAK